MAVNSRARTELIAGKGLQWVIATPELSFLRRPTEVTKDGLHVTVFSRGDFETIHVFEVEDGTAAAISLIDSILCQPNFRICRYDWLLNAARELNRGCDFHETLIACRFSKIVTTPNRRRVQVVMEICGLARFKMHCSLCENTPELPNVRPVPCRGHWKAPSSCFHCITSPCFCLTNNNYSSYLTITIHRCKQFHLGCWFSPLHQPRTE